MAQSPHFETIQSKTALNSVNAPSMPFSWSFNPYRGCQHGCSFCYARSTHEFIGLESDDTFQKHILIKGNAPEALEQQLVKMLRSANGRSRLGTIALGTATDPYQQIEAKAGITRRSLEIFAHYQVPVSITTRSPLLLRDLDILSKIPEVSVNVSIHTLDMQTWRSFEPFSPLPAKRLDMAAQLSKRGIHTNIFLAPILPFITDSEQHLFPLLSAIADTKPSSVMPSLLRLKDRAVKVWFFQTLQLHYPHLNSRYADLYRNRAYPSASYRESAMGSIRRLLIQHNLHEHKIKQEKSESALPRHETLVQLEFSF